MRVYILLFLTTCLAYNVNGQDAGKTPYQTKSLASDGIKDVYLKTSGGSISVSGASGETPRIEVFITGNNGRSLSAEDVKKRLSEDYELDIAVHDHELHALAKKKHDGNWDWKRSLNISFKVYVPKQVATYLNTSGGSINLDNLIGKETFSTSGGSMRIEHLTGVIKGETSGGSIDVTNSSDDINLQTSGGSVHASNCAGKIKLETSGGSLDLKGLRGVINASTSGGSVHADNIEGELITGTSGGSVDLSRLSCSLEASTSGGNMQVQMLKLGKYIKLDVNGGQVDLKLPAKQGMNLNLSANKINPATSVSGFAGKWEKESVNGSINGGGIPVKVDASDRLDISFN